METNVQLVKNILKTTFGIVPIVAGLDKFTNILTDCTHYLPAGVVDMLPMQASTFIHLLNIKIKEA